MHLRQSSFPPYVDAQAPFGVVVVAASFGGLQALTRLLAPLPAEFPVPIVVVQHLSPRYASVFAEVLGRRTRLRAGWAEHEMPLRPGNIYVAPPDRHVQVASRSTLALSDGPKVHWTRPAADVLFTSAAALYADRAIGVVLTGYGRDGAAGARAIKDAGGRVITEDPAMAEASPMPDATIRTRAIDFVFPLDRIAPALISLCMAPGAASLFAVAPAHIAHLP